MAIALSLFASICAVPALFLSIYNCIEMQFLKRDLRAQTAARDAAITADTMRLLYRDRPDASVMVDNLEYENEDEDDLEV